LLACQSIQAQVNIQNLKCELLSNPTGISSSTPRLSWQIVATQNNVQQTAYQILVASSKEKLTKNEGDLWNSGKVNSGQSIHIQYNGKPLQSRSSCYWKVKSFTNKGETAWSEAAFFQ